MNFLTRAREWVLDPNPIVRKELLALLRTPVYVRSVVVALVALAVVVMSAAIGVTDSPSSDTTDAGKALFQIFFGATYFVMSLVGPTFGATAIVGEREGRTLDALTLSALGPGRVVAGKLVAVFVAMSLIPVAAMPMMGLVLLFGGVSLAHIAIAGFWVLLLGACGVAFGVAVSARAQTTRRALAGAAPLALFTTMTLGSLLAAVGHEYARHHSLTFEGPFFFADAYLAVPFGREYLVQLVLMPACVMGVTLWLFYAVAYGGMMEPSEDTTLVLKRWVIGAHAWMLATLVVCLRVMSADTQTRRVFAVLWVAMVVSILVAMVFAFVAEPLRVTRRMKVHPPSALTALVTPATLVPSTAFCVAVGFLASVGGVVACIGRDPDFLSYALWGASFLAGFSGLLTWAAARNLANGAGAARLAGVIVLFLVLVGSWLLAMLIGDVGSPATHPSWVLVISPSWALMSAFGVLVDRHSTDMVDVQPALLAGSVAWGAVAAVGWTRSFMLMAAARREEKTR